jgi:RimJ/RimL family protein N-acetyltransferase
MLVGKRVKLRPFEESDIALMVKWWNRPAVWENFFYKFPLSHSGQVSWYKALFQNKQCLFLIIETIEAHRPIGTIGLDRIDHVNQTSEYGNLMIGHEESTGLGLAKEATLLLLTYGFDRLNLNRIFLQVLIDNVRAIELYKSCGFREEGKLREAFFDKGQFKDVLVMAMLRAEHRRLPAAL